MRGPDHVLPLVRRLKGRLADVYGDRLAGVVLFGSYARGDAGPDSDVDLLVLLEGPVERWAETARLADLAYGVELETGLLLSLIPRTTAEYRAAETPLLCNVHAEGVAA